MKEINILLFLTLPMFIHSMESVHEDSFSVDTFIERFQDRIAKNPPILNRQKNKLEEGLLKLSCYDFEGAAEIFTLCKTIHFQHWEHQKGDYVSRKTPDPLAYLGLSFSSIKLGSIKAAEKYLKRTGELAAKRGDEEMHKLTIEYLKFLSK